jgi:hypothetical protein
MTSFFYVVSIVFHTSVQHFGSAWIPLEKKLFWLRAQPLMHRLLHLFIRPERLASNHLFERSKDTKVTGGVRSGKYGRCERPSKDRSWIVATVEWAVWGRALSCWSKTQCTQMSTWFGLDCRMQVIL